MFLLIILQFFSASAAAAELPNCTVDATEFPQADKPLTADYDSLRGCASKKFYYGIGEPVDFAKARKCAFLELERNAQLVFGDYAMLMMIYANGHGVKKDIDLAKRIALCHVGGSEFEITARQAHLERLKTSKETSNFDICNDITSGVMMGFCSSINEEQAAAKRKKELDLIVSKWPQKHQIEFQKLYVKANSFFDMRSMEEIDKSGSARAQDITEDQAQQKSQFHKAIKDFENSKYPPFTADDLKKLDQDLSTLYQIVMSKRDSSRADVAKVGIRKVQREWFSYRDAWVGFARLHYPRLPVDSLRAWLTTQRMDQLKDVKQLLQIHGISKDEYEEANK